MAELAQVGPYRIERELGRGGMGAVYAALDTRLDRRVALKVLLAAGSNPTHIERFQREAQACASLHHPNIVPVHDAGYSGDRLFIVMDLIEGESLDQRLKRGPIPAPEAVRIMSVVARAIEAAHAQDLLHRDLKPANVILDLQGDPHVTDFGLAKNLQSEDRLTQTGQVLGTPAFMSPEQADGEVTAFGPPTDVYGLGATLFALLTARPPFDGRTPLQLVAAVLGKAPPPPSRFVSTLSPELDAVVLKALEKDPQKRYPSAAAFADDLDRFAAGKPTVARPLGRITSLRRTLKRRRGLLLLAAAVGIVVSGALLVALARGRTRVAAEQALLKYQHLETNLLATWALGLNRSEEPPSPNPLRAQLDALAAAPPGELTLRALRRGRAILASLEADAAWHLPPDPLPVELLLAAQRSRDRDPQQAFEHLSAALAVDSWGPQRLRLAARAAQGQALKAFDPMAWLTQAVTDPNRLAEAGPVLEEFYVRRFMGEHLHRTTRAAVSQLKTPRHAELKRRGAARAMARLGAQLSTWIEDDREGKELERLIRLAHQAPSIVTNGDDNRWVQPLGALVRLLAERHRASNTPTRQAIAFRWAERAAWAEFLLFYRLNHPLRTDPPWLALLAWAEPLRRRWKSPGAQALLFALRRYEFKKRDFGNPAQIQMIKFARDQRLIDVSLRRAVIAWQGTVLPVQGRHKNNLLSLARRLVPLVRNREGRRRDDLAPERLLAAIFSLTPRGLVPPHLRIQGVKDVPPATRAGIDQVALECTELALARSARWPFPEQRTSFRVRVAEIRLGLLVRRGLEAQRAEVERQLPEFRQRATRPEATPSDRQALGSYLSAWAATLRRAKRLSEALDHYREALPHVQEHRRPSIQSAMAQCLFGLGKHAQALTMYKQHPEAYLAKTDYTRVRLDILWHTGKRTEARRLVERAAAAGASKRGLKALRLRLRQLEAGS